MEPPLEIPNFSEEEKQSIARQAVETASQALRMAQVMTKSERFIVADCDFEDGSTWTLKWEKKESDHDKKTS